ncbi:MAG: right-handed parallel beta-helix repeat-containing protein [Spirochaetales bacterium]|nr:right-handed parallel beta-helix repeat-containing protein [Spirochaetales bacterium]
MAGYYLDCGKTYALHENGYTYGWEKAGNGKINSKTNMPGIDMCGKGHTPLKDRNDCLESTWLYMTGETGWKILLENGYYRIRAGFADPVRPYGLYKKADDTFEIYINNKHYALEAGDRFFFGNNDRDLMMLDDVIVSEFCGNQLVIRGGVQKIAIQYLEIEKIDDVIVNRCYASDDTYIESGKRGRLNVNGDKPYVIVQDFEKFSGSKKIGCLEFAPDNVAGIHSAYLSLYYHGSDGGPPHTVSLQLYAIDGHDFDETSLNWNNAAFITGEDKYKTDIIKEALLVDEILLDKTDNSYCSFDITSYMKDRFDSVVTFLLVCGKGTDLGSVFFSKEAGVNPPFIEINRVKNRISQTGFLTGNRESGFELATYNGTVFDGETYNLESDYLNLEEYTDCNVRITGYFVPEQDVPVDRTIHVEDLNAVAPDKPELIVDRINKDGRPVWAWNKPIGALLFAYSLDDGEWTDAVETSFSPAIPLPEGTHRLRLKCRNRLLWSETAEAAVLIDMTAPEITSMAFDTPTKNRKPVFIWTARDGLTNDRELVYRYRIDEGEWHLSIENRYTPGENLSEGNHMFGIGARDLAGNWSDVREYPFCIDITPPRVTDVSYETPTMDRRPRFQWSADDNYTETGDIEYLICFYSPSQDESVPDDSGKAAEGFIVTKETSFTSSSDAGDGSHMFMISARDRAGNCSILENHEVIVDTTPPLIHNLDYHDSESGPAYIWDVTDNYSPEEDIDYECLLTTDNDSDGNWKPVSGNSIAIDPLYRTTAHTFTLRAKDRAGNMSEKSADTKSGVTIACGEVTLAIPENALQEIVPIRISKADPLQLAPDDTDKVIIAQCAFELKPDGLTFSRSYTLSIDYSGYELLCDEDYLGIYYYDENEKHWEQVMPSETDKIGKIITAQCNHFSVFALGYPIVNEIAMFAPEKPAGQTVGEWFVDAPDSVINAVRNRITENPDIDIVTVYVRGGDYYCGTEDEVLILEDIDFGFGRKVVFKALPGENVRIIGGVRIRADLFHPVTDPLILQKIPDEAGEIVRVVDLVNDVGIDEFPDLKHRGRNTEGRNAVYKTDDLNQEFYFNRRPMQIARWPNKELVGPDDNSVCSQEDYARMTRRGELSFDVALPEEDRSRPGRWTESAGKDLWIFYFNNNNEEELMKVRDISGNTVNLAYMDDPEDSGLLDNHLFYAFNVLEELDSPGEYFLDRDPEHPANHGRLYFYPPEDLVDDMYLSNTKTLMTVRNCSNMTFDGFVFEGSKENCVEVWNSNNIVFEQCVIRNAGKAGILISTEIDGETGRHAYNGDRGLSDNHPVNTLNSRNCGLKDSEVYDTGENAVVIDGGNRAYLKPCRHFLQNCSIHHFGRVEKSRTAVIISGIGINVIHNEISRGPSMGIYYFGNDHLIQYNNIYRVCQEVEDMGAVYSGMDIGYRGNVIKNNLIYHIKTKFKDEEGVHCIYFDQGYSSAEVLGNIIYDSNGMAVFVGGGRDNKIKYNVIAEHGGAAIINRCAFLDRYWGDNDFELDKKLSEFRYWTSPWSYRYHDLMRHYYDENKYDRTMPFWNKLDDNIIYRSNLYPLMPTATLEDLESYGLEIVSVSEHRTEMLYHIDIPITEDLHLKWDVTIIFPFNVYLFNTGYVKIGSFAGEPGGINMAVPIFDPYFFTSFIIDALMSDKYLSNKNNAIVDPGFVDPDNENFTFSASSIIHELRDSWQSGLWDPILDGETYFGRIPNKPVVILEPDAENNRIRVTGNCDPWAEIKEAVLYGLDESGGVVNSLAVTDNLTRQDNGSISGILYPPGAFYTSQFCVLDITLKHSKEASYALEAVTGRSGRINFTYTDTTAPEITVFDVNDPVITDGGIEISFDCEAEDDVGISQWMITLAAEKPFFFDERWEDEKPDMVVLPLASGTYHLYVWAKDASNNISDSMSDTVVIDPIPVSGVMQYTSPGLYEWRITDKYLTVTNVIVNVTLIAGGGGGGGGASNSDIGLNFWGDCVAGCTDKASGGGGGGAGEAIELTLSEADMTFDKYRLIEIVVGGPGTGGDGGGKQHSGKSGTSGGYSRFDTHTARPGGGGGGGNNDSSSWGKGGSGYPGGGNHSGREGGEGGNNGSGYGRGGDGGRGTKYSEGGKDGDNGGKGYVRIEWTGNL